jgi:hypothetical protein
MRLTVSLSLPFGHHNAQQLTHIALRKLSQLWQVKLALINTYLGISWDKGIAQAGH